jgi:tyrosyl-tRNA synthetase
MKKSEKIVVTTFGHTTTFVVSEELDKLKGKHKLPPKYEEAKERLAKIKSFPK